MAIAILDIDGTLVDTNYHHAIAWFRAFRQHGIVLPLWRIHRHIGMGGDQLVGALTDERTEREQGDDIRGAEKTRYFELIDEVDHYLDLLDARELTDAWTTSADVESTKPEPDLVRAALDRAGGSSDGAVMVGDTPWDIHAARNAGVPTVTVRTGGFGADELREAGAIAIFESVAELRSRLDETPLA